MHSTNSVTFRFPTLAAADFADTFFASVGAFVADRDFVALEIQAGTNITITQDGDNAVINGVENTPTTIPLHDPLAAYPILDTPVRAASGNLFVNRVAIPAATFGTTVTDLESAFHGVGGSGDFITFVFPSTFTPVTTDIYTLSYRLAGVRRIQFDGSDISLLTSTTNVYIVSVDDIRLVAGTTATGFTTGQPATIDDPQLSHSATGTLPNLDPELDNGVSGRWEQVARIDALDPSRYLLSANSRLEWTENNLSVRGVVSEIEEVSINTSGEPVTYTINQTTGDITIAGLTADRATAMINAGRVASHLEDAASIIIVRVAAIAGSTTSVTWLPVAANLDIGVLNEAETRAALISLGNFSSRLQISLIVESEVAPGTISIESSVQPTGYLVNTAARRIDIGFDPATFINAGDDLTYTVTIANTPDNIATFIGSDVTEDTTSGVNVSEWRINEADIIFSQGSFATLPSGFQTGGITLSERVNTLSVGEGLDLTVDGLQATFDVANDNIVNASVGDDTLTLTKRQGDPVTFRGHITTLDTFFNDSAIQWRKDPTTLVIEFPNQGTPAASPDAIYRIDLSESNDPMVNEAFVFASGANVVVAQNVNTWEIEEVNLTNTVLYNQIVDGTTGTSVEIDVEQEIERLRAGDHVTAIAAPEGLVTLDVDLDSVRRNIVLPAPGFTLRDEFTFTFLVPNNLNPVASARENGIWEMRFAAEGMLTATEVRDRALQMFGIQNGGSSRATSHLTHDIVLTSTADSSLTGTLLGGRVQISARGTNEISLAWENTRDGNAFLDGLGISSTDTPITVQSPITDTIVSVNGTGTDIEVTSDGDGIATINYTGTGGGGGNQYIVLDTTDQTVNEADTVEISSFDPSQVEVPIETIVSAVGTASQFRINYSGAMVNASPNATYHFEVNPVYEEFGTLTPFVRSPISAEFFEEGNRLDLLFTGTPPALTNFVDGSIFQVGVQIAAGDRREYYFAKESIVSAGVTWRVFTRDLLRGSGLHFPGSLPTVTDGSAVRRPSFEVVFDTIDVTTAIAGQWLINKSSLSLFVDGVELEAGDSVRTLLLANGYTYSATVSASLTFQQVFPDVFHLSFASTAITNYLRKQVTTGQNPVNETNFYTYIDDFVEIFTELDLQVEAPLTLNRGVIGLDTSRLPAPVLPEGTVTFHGNIDDDATYTSMIVDTFGNEGDEFYVHTALTGGPSGEVQSSAATEVTVDVVNRSGVNTAYLLVAPGTTPGFANRQLIVINTNTARGDIRNSGNTALAVNDIVYAPDGTPLEVELLAPGYFSTLATGNDRAVRFAYGPAGGNPPAGRNTGDATGVAPFGLVDGANLFYNAPGTAAAAGLYKKVNDNWTITNITFTTL